MAEIYDTDEMIERVILVGVQLGDETEAENSLEELKELARTAGAETVGKMLQPREYFHPATNALWFYSPGTGNACKTTWFNQANAGKYKNHCFYEPAKGVCKSLH